MTEPNEGDDLEYLKGFVADHGGIADAVTNARQVIAASEQGGAPSTIERGRALARADAANVKVAQGAPFAKLRDEHHAADSDAFAKLRGA